MDSSFASLKAEHLEISRALQRAVQVLEQGQMSQGSEALQVLQSLLQRHFQHENELLFSRVVGHPRLSQGGPLCTMYFDSFIHQRPFQKLLALMRKVKPSFVLPVMDVPEQKYISEGSSLAIPSEEHLAMFVLVQELISLLQEGSSLWSPDWQDEALDQLRTWIRINHEKEENCFFLLSENLLKK